MEPLDSSELITKVIAIPELLTAMGSTLTELDIPVDAFTSLPFYLQLGIFVKLLNKVDISVTVDKNGYCSYFDSTESPLFKGELLHKEDLIIVDETTFESEILTNYFRCFKHTLERLIIPF